MSSSVYQILLNSHALIELSIDGKILWVNENFLNLFGYTIDEIIGKHQSVLIPETEIHRREHQDMWNNLLAGNVETGEFMRITKDHSKIWLNGSYNPIKDEDGNVLKILKMAIDVTEKKHLAKHLEQKNKELQHAVAHARAATQAKSAFLANMSHEIRTPLNSIIGITDSLAETNLDAHQQDFVKILKRANHQLMTIINDILDLTKIESGEIQLQCFPFDLKKVLDDVESVLGFRAREKGLCLAATIDPDLDQYFIGDSDRLRQILINLVTNSIKFTHEGFITIHIKKNDTGNRGNILFIVSDSGIGIPKNKHHDIFKAFTQADSTTTRKYGGTGLGLSISQKIVELMNGHLWLESSLGTGSVFFFSVTMPQTTERKILMHSASQDILLGSTTEGIITTKRTLKILIVDDVEDNRNLFGIYLRHSNHNIQFAESGVEALKLIETNHFDIIFMDVQMPGMDGHETTRIIREIEKLDQRKPAKIFACTANAFVEDIEKSISAGCDMHLSKPIRKESLMTIINSESLTPAEVGS